MHPPAQHSIYRTRQRRRRRAFTLLEIIVVVTIIALLAGVVMPRLLGNIGSSKAKLAKSDVAQIANQVNLWMADNGMDQLPNDFSLEQLADPQSGTLDADDLLDPWDRPYVLIFPPQYNRDFDIVSYGPDGQPGGEDDIHN